MKRSYNVVLEGQGGPDSNYRGVRTITGFTSKEEFDEWKRNTANRDKIVAEGVSDTEAARLAAQTSVEARLLALQAEVAEQPMLAKTHAFNTMFALAADLEQGYHPPFFIEGDSD